MAYQFCVNGELKPKLVELLNENLQFPEGYVDNTYTFFEKNFSSKIEAEKYRDGLGLDFGYLNNLRSKMFIDNDASTVGIDLPTWINIGNGKGTIMIVGQDPLRTYKEFKHIQIGNPYCLDVEPGREKSIYWQIIEPLLNDGYGIYLTDTFKVFYYTTDKMKISSKQKEFTHPHEYDKERYIDIHQHLFQMECEIVKPSLIITFGNFPRIWFSPDGYKKGYSLLSIKNRVDNASLPLLQYENIPMLSVPHPASRSSDYKNFFGEQSGTKAEAYKNYIHQFIKLHM